LSDPELAGELRQRYAEARRAMLPVFREALGAAGEEAEDVGDELLAVVDGLTVAALTDRTLGGTRPRGNSRCYRACW
jgi:transcriptional regulator BetI-like protein